MISIMSSKLDSPDRVVPSATPNEDDIRAWEALPRDEQLRRLRESLTHPDCSTAVSDTMSEILELARARADARSRG
jgi:hypothetical protein